MATLLLVIRAAFSEITECLVLFCCLPVVLQPFVGSPPAPVEFFVEEECSGFNWGLPRCALWNSLVTAELYSSGVGRNDRTGVANYHYKYREPINCFWPTNLLAITLPCSQSEASGLIGQNV